MSKKRIAISSLVKEIFPKEHIGKSTDTYASDLKRVQRIELLLRNTSDAYYCNEKGVPVDQKDNFVNLVRAIDANSDIKTKLAKLSKGKTISVEDYDVLLEEIMKHSGDEEFNENAKMTVKIMDECFEMRAKIRKKESEIIEMFENFYGMDSPDKFLDFLNFYYEYLDEIPMNIISKFFNIPNMEENFEKYMQENPD